MKGDTQVGGLANGAVWETVPASEVPGGRILPIFVLILEESLFEVGMEFIIVFHMADDEPLDGGNRDVELEATIDSSFPHIRNQKRIQITSQLFRAIDPVQNLERIHRRRPALLQVFNLLDRRIQL